MKRFTLMLFAAMLAVAGFAQKPSAVVGLKNHQIAPNALVKGLKSAYRKAPRKAAELVTVPENVEPYEVLMTGTFIDWDNDGNQNVSSISRGAWVAVDGTDVYIQGLSYYVPDGWVKGTLDEEGAVTFTSGQYYGPLFLSNGSQYDFYFAGYAYDEETDEELLDDVVFLYDEESGDLVQISDYYLENGKEDEPYYYGIFTNVALTKVVEAVATPADPEIITFSGIGSSGYGWVVADIPLVDTDGNSLVPSKLSYQFFSDIDGEIAPIVFTPEYYENLTEDLSIVPYTFTDSYDFDVDGSNKVVYLNDPIVDSYTRIGVKSIYEGGGEVHETEIIWFDIEQEEPAAVPTEWVASEQGYENAEAVTDITLREGVTGVVDQATGQNPPKYYAAGDALRVYANNTLTITSEEKNIEKIEFTFVSGNKYNNLEANVGDFVVEGTVGTWTGSETEIVFTVPTEQARIQKIVVKLEGDAEPVELVTVEVPENLETEAYLFTAFDVYYEEDAAAREIQIGFDGSDVYFQGLSEALPEAWVKGSIDEDGIIEVPAGQYLGVFDYYGIFQFDIFFGGATISYDQATGTFVTDEGYITYGEDEEDVWDEFTDVLIQPIVEKVAVPELPEVTGLTYGKSDDQWYIEFEIPVVDVDGAPLVADKLAYEVYYEANGEVQQLVLTPDVYTRIGDEEISTIPARFTDNWDVQYYGTSYRIYLYNDDLDTWTKIGVKSIYVGGGEQNETEINWFVIDDETKDAVGIENVDQTTAVETTVVDLAGRRVNGSARGIVIKSVRRADGSVQVVKELRK